MSYELTNNQATLAKWVDIRQKRNELLFATDWWAVSDRVMSEAEKNYRQNLRDLPTSFSDPDQVVFPALPQE